MKTYAQLLDSPPDTIPWSEVVDFDRWDERRSCVDVLFANIIGVEDGFVEWLPNEDPPSREEVLAWIWAVRPDLGNEIIPDATTRL